jgi:WD40 repeat protein
MSAARAAAEVVAVIARQPEPEQRLRDAAAHWRRANVLPDLPATGADIAGGVTDDPAAVAARRLAVLADDAEPADRAAFGFLSLLVRALRDEFPARHRDVEMPVLFDRRSTGGHGSLRIMLLNGGPPGIYPDPRAMLFLVADRPFADALDTAWRTAPPALHDRCVVWRLTTDGLACDEVAGGSLGGAFGVGLAELARRTPPYLRARRLDRRCAVTAALRPDAGLARVGGIRNKLEEAIRQRLRVIVARSPDPDRVPDQLAREAKVRYAADLPAAIRLSRTRVNPSFVAVLAALVLAVGGSAGGALAAVRESRAAHVREVAGKLLAEAVTVRQSSPGDALLLEALSVQLGGSGARATLIRDLMANRYAGFLTEARDHVPCGGSQSWSPDSTQVATAGQGALALWDVARRSVIRTFPVTARISGCAFAPDGKSIAFAADGRLTSAPLDARPPSGPFDLGTEGPVQIQYAPDGVLATAAPDQPVTLWSVSGEGPPRRLGTVGGTVPTNALRMRDKLLAFTADARTLIVGEQDRVVLVDVTRPGAPRRIGSIPVDPSSVAVSSQGRLAIGGLSGVTELWDVSDPGRPRRTGSVQARDGTRFAISSVAFTPDGQQLITSNFTLGDIWRVGGDSAPEYVRALTANPHQVSAAALAPDGTTVLINDADGVPSFWRIANHTAPAAVATLPLDRARISGVAFLPGTRRLVVTAAGGAATVWDAGTPRRARLIQAVGPDNGRGKTVNTADTWATAFGPDGRRYASTDGDWGIGVWAAGPDGRVAQTGSIPASAQTRLVPLGLSPGSDLLAVKDVGKDGFETSDGPVSLWDIRNDPRLIGRVPDGITAQTAAFTPDGRTLVTVNRENATSQATVTWWSITNPERPVVAAQRRVALEGTPGRTVFTSDGRLTFVTEPGAPGAAWDTSEPGSPALLTTQPGLGGGRAGDAALLEHALLLGTLGAVNIWDVTDRETATRATAFASRSGGPFRGFLAVAPTGLLAAVQYADAESAFYTSDSLVTLWDITPILDILADPVAAACRVAGHDLSAELWRRHAPDLERRPVCR